MTEQGKNALNLKTVAGSLAWPPAYLPGAFVDLDSRQVGSSRPTTWNDYNLMSGMSEIDDDHIWDE